MGCRLKNSVRSCQIPRECYLIFLLFRCHWTQRNVYAVFWRVRTLQGTPTEAVLTQKIEKSGIFNSNLQPLRLTFICDDGSEYPVRQPYWLSNTFSKRQFNGRSSLKRAMICAKINLWFKSLLLWISYCERRIWIYGWRLIKSSLPAQNTVLCNSSHLSHWQLSLMSIKTACWIFSVNTTPMTARMASTASTPRWWKRTYGVVVSTHM